MSEQKISPHTIVLHLHMLLVYKAKDESTVFVTRLSSRAVYFHTNFTHLLNKPMVRIPSPMQVQCQGSISWVGNKHCGNEMQYGSLLQIGKQPLGPCALYHWSKIIQSLAFNFNHNLLTSIPLMAS